MTTHRVAQAQNLLKRELLQWMAKHFEAPNGAIVTVEDVTMSPDLLSARVAVSVYPSIQRKPVLKELRGRLREARAAVAKRIRWRAVPQITIIADDREEKADRVFQLLNKEEE